MSSTKERCLLVIHSEWQLFNRSNRNQALPVWKRSAKNRYRSKLNSIEDISNKWTPVQVTPTPPSRIMDSMHHFPIDFSHIHDWNCAPKMVCHKKKKKMRTKLPENDEKGANKTMPFRSMVSMMFSRSYNFQIPRTEIGEQKGGGEARCQRRWK